MSKSPTISKTRAFLYGYGDTAYAIPKNPYPIKKVATYLKTRYVFMFRYKYVSQNIKQTWECTASEYKEAHDKFIRHVGSRKMIQDNFTVEEFPEV